MLTPRFSRTTCACLVALSVSTSAGAQTLASEPPRQAMAVQPTPAAAPVPEKAGTPSLGQVMASLGGDFKRLASKQSLYLAGVGFLGSATVHPWDRTLTGARWGGNDVAEAMAPGRIVGSFATQAGGAFATYLIGRATDRPAVATLGAELFRAQIVAQATTQALKVGTRRTRPDGTSLSFPSGHTAAGFATATVLHAKFGWKAGVPAYAVASWIAASRLQTRRHHLSDVVAGATLGILAGRSVTVGYRSTKFAVSPVVVPGGAGVNLVRIGQR